MYKLLLIEDDKQLSEMYAKKLSGSGWHVMVCHDGADSVQHAKKHEFDAIILDLMIPGIPGIEVLGLIRQDKRTARTPIIVCTNYGDKFNKEKCILYGADDFLLKVDSTPEKLLTLLEGFVARTA